MFSYFLIQFSVAVMYFVIEHERSRSLTLRLRLAHIINTRQMSQWRDYSVVIWPTSH